MPSRTLFSARVQHSATDLRDAKETTMPPTPSDYKFSFGPWNISEGADPFGPAVRPAVAWADKLPLFKRLGFDAVMFHDDDIVPQIEEKTPQQIDREAREMKRTLDN